MEITPIAYFHSPLTTKFGVPRQSGLARSLAGHIVLEPPYRSMDALRGLEGFDYVWLVWEFSANRPTAHNDHDGDALAPPSLTVRPPRLGGNRRMGVFATRSPFRPNRLGLSCVRIDHIADDPQLGPVIHVLGADLMDLTPIYDIKPYVAYADSHPEARSGFVDATAWEPLQVDIPHPIASLFSPVELSALRDILSQDPRPRYHADGQRIYGMPFAGRDVRFRVEDGVVHVIGAEPLHRCPQKVKQVVLPSEA